jgi:hypothetical protein
MDAQIIERLNAAQMPTDPLSLALAIPPQLEQRPVVVEHEGRQVELALRPLSNLFSGTAAAPKFKREPPAEYVPFFATVEAAAGFACLARGRPERDEEFERLYRHLRRRPDGTDSNPLFYWLQNAARIYLSLRVTSRAEFEAVMDRLSQSARTFHTHVGSTNYFTHALQPLLGRAGR